MRPSATAFEPGPKSATRGAENSILKVQEAYNTLRGLKHFQAMALHQSELDNELRLNTLDLATGRGRATDTESAVF